MSSKNGFTLIEILVVVVIISIAVIVVYPISTKILDKFNAYIENVEKKHLHIKEEFDKFLQDE